MCTCSHDNNYDNCTCVRVNSHNGNYDNCLIIVCSYINERNRQRNVSRAEQALKVSSPSPTAVYAFHHSLHIVMHVYMYKWCLL